MIVRVTFYSYFKELAGCSETSEEMAEASTLNQLSDAVLIRFPRLAGARKSMLMAVGVDYQTRDYILKEGDVVSFFPPVQGG